MEIFIKNILLSADNEISVFSVPDEVADNLKKYCLKFCCNWLPNSPDAAKYRIKICGVNGFSYSEKDFINYLNQYICDEKSVLVTTLNGVYGKDKLPDEYIGLPYFNF